MKNQEKKYSTLLKCAGKTVRKMAAVALAGLIAVSATGIANAATLADIFDAEEYAGKYADLKAAFGDDTKALFKHYKAYGIDEERESGGLLNVVKYRQAYEDLDAAFGDNWDAYVE